jgi:hypothetical protein
LEVDARATLESAAGATFAPAAAFIEALGALALAISLAATFATTSPLLSAAPLDAAPAISIIQQQNKDSGCRRTNRTAESFPTSSEGTGGTSLDEIHDPPLSQ